MAEEMRNMGTHKMELGVRRLAFWFRCTKYDCYRN